VCAAFTLAAGADTDADCGPVAEIFRRQNQTTGKLQQQHCNNNNNNNDNNNDKTLQ